MLCPYDPPPIPSALRDHARGLAQAARCVEAMPGARNLLSTRLAVADLRRRAANLQARADLLDLATPLQPLGA